MRRAQEFLEGDRAMAAMLLVVTVMIGGVASAGAVFLDQALRDHWVHATVGALPLLLAIGVIIHDRIAPSWDDGNFFLAGCGAAAWTVGALFAAFVEFVCLPGWNALLGLVHLYLN